MDDKYPPLKCVDLKTLRKVLKTNKRRDRKFGLDELMVALRIDAPEADAIAREAAAAGYLGWKGGGWVISSLGNRLRIDTLRKRMPRAQADTILDTVLERIEAFNREPDHLVRIDQADLFGSYLAPDREMLGDLDLAVNIVRRDLDKDERARIEALIEPGLPDSYRFGSMSAFGEERYERQRVLRDLRAGLPGLSLTTESMEINRFAHMAVYVSDGEKGRRVPPAERVMVFPENLGKTVITDEEDFEPIPAVTCRVPDWLPPDDEPVVLDTRGIDSRDIDAITAIACDPGRDDLDDPAYKLAGAHHLCPAWTREQGGVAMLAETLDWGRAHGLIDEKRLIGPHTMSFCFDGRHSRAFLEGSIHNARADGPVTELSGQVPSFFWLRHDRWAGEAPTSITRNRLAYEWSIAQSLRRCAAELKLKPEFNGIITYSIDILLSEGVSSLPDLTAVVPLARDILEQGEGRYENSSNLSITLQENENDPQGLFPHFDVVFDGLAMQISTAVKARITERFEARRDEFEKIMKSAPGFAAIDHFEGCNRKNQVIAKDLEDQDPGPRPFDW